MSASPVDEGLLRQVADTLEQHRHTVVGLSHAIAADPELAHEEHRAMDRCAGVLEQAGIEVERGAYGLPTAFAARFGSGDTHVVLCAEYDALPEVGHACGHNVIAAAAVGAGLVLAPLAEAAGLRVTVLGTPAEERFGGKVDLLDAGAFDDADAALMVHPTPYDEYGPRSLGIEEWQVVYTGRASHASAAPEQGRNALDGLVAGYQAVAMLRQHLRPQQQVHGIITHGGDAPNVVPERTEGLFYLRARTPDDLADLRERVRACLQGAATATGTSVEITPVGHTYLPLRPHAGLVGAFTDACAALGRPYTPDPQGDGLGGSTDFGNVSQRLPGLHAYVAVHSWPAVNHQHEFAAHCVTPQADETLLQSAGALALTALAVAGDPGVLHDPDPTS
ncbi:amidohydrolase [Quadrisphaera sp. GCM10027208]|uniref:amidohydrolase n=1 Tax=Quadrisphaera sp. GCM10027208 TaxID=3273423 RepID=UPI003620E2DA